MKCGQVWVITEEHVSCWRLVLYFDGFMSLKLCIRLSSIIVAFT